MAKKRQAPEELELSYRFGLFGSERYVLRDRALEVAFRTLLETNRYVVDLVTLDPVYSRYAAWPRRWLGGSLGLAVLAAILAVACAQGPALGLNAWIWALPAMSLTGALISFVQAVLLRQNCVSFHRIEDGTPNVNLQIRKCDPEAFQRFVLALQERVEECRFESEEGGLAAELHSLDRMLREGRLSEQEFRAAKAMLLGMEPWQLDE